MKIKVVLMEKSKFGIYTEREEIEVDLSVDTPMFALPGRTGQWIKIVKGDK